MSLPHRITEYLDGNANVARYAFFGDFYSGAGWDLLNANGTLNALGQIYVSTAN